MPVNCPNCGNMVRDGAPYCDLCHSLLERGAQSYLPNGSQLPPVSPVSAHKAAAAPEPGPTPTPPVPSPSERIMAPSQPYTPWVAPEALESYNRSLLISVAVLAFAGILVACCTFMPWMGLDLGLGLKMNVSGWQIFREAGELGGNPFYIRFAGISVFTGLCSLVGGIVMAGLSGALLIWRRLELAYAIFPVTLLTLGVAIINTFNINKIGFSLGFGTILFLLASIAGIAAGFFIRQDLAG